MLRQQRADDVIVPRRDHRLGQYGEQRLGYYGRRHNVTTYYDDAKISKHFSISHCFAGTAEKRVLIVCVRASLCTDTIK